MDNDNLFVINSPNQFPAICYKGFFFPLFSPPLLLKTPLMKSPPLLQIILVCNLVLASRFLKIYEGMLELDSTVKRLVEDYP